MNLLKKIIFAISTIIFLFFITEICSRLFWAHLDNKARVERLAKAEGILRNDGINFMKKADNIFGYVLKPGDYGAIKINAQGFNENQETAMNKTDNFYRIICLGESTTQGHGNRTGNYPKYLQTKINKELGKRVEVINAGVSGWISDQVALMVEHKISKMSPDLVILYAGWNDFQSYNPLSVPPAESYFESAFGKKLLNTTTQFKSIAFLYEIILKFKVHSSPKNKYKNDNSLVVPNKTYKFYLENLDKIISCLRTQSPKTRIVICTLVGRWPWGDFNAKNGAVWWMTQEGLTPDEAAEYLEKFNNLIRVYAKKNDLLLVDISKQMNNEDKKKIMWDFAHFTDEGYKILADNIYETLKSQKVFQNTP